MSLKHYFDALFALAALPLVIFLVCVAGCIVKCQSPGPIFFTQKRVGLNGQPFTIFKIRTMHAGIDHGVAQTQLNDRMVFPWGRILRRFKIDETPQILNVLLGQMSIVGPRPCLISSFDNMPEWAKKRVSVRPGITGLAQINGNVRLSWDQRWKLDVEYVEHASFLLDVYILLQTVKVTLMGEEVSEKGKSI